MANREHFEHLKQGVKRWNQWRNENPCEKPDLAEVNLEGTALAEVNFEGVNLTGVNLKWANLWRAHLVKADLTKADLRMADLTESRLRGADLTRTDLRGTVLVDADFQEACLAMANLSGANMTGAKLYKSICEGWIIDEIVCAYIFLEPEGSQRYPVGRNFRLKEFEKYSKRSQSASRMSSMVLQQIVHIFSLHSFQRNEKHPNSQDIGRDDEYVF